jgi:hypothetical protein
MEVIDEDIVPWVVLNPLSLIGFVPDSTVRVSMTNWVCARYEKAKCTFLVGSDAHWHPAITVRYEVYRCQLNV